MTYARNSATSPQAVRAAKIESDALRLRMEGLNYDDIADTMGISRAQAATAVKRGMKRMRDETQESVQQIKDTELARLDWLYRIAFQRSRNGSVESMKVCLQIMERRAKLLGLDAAIKAQLNAGPAALDLTKLTDAQLAEMETLAMQAMEGGVTEVVNLDEVPEYGNAG